MEPAIRRLLITGLLVVATVRPGRADVIYTCDPSIGATLCSSINSIVGGIYDSTFTNANTSIFITFNGSPPGLPPLPNNFVSGSLRYFNAVSYGTWRSALIGAETDANDVLAVNDNVPSAEPGLFAGDQIVLTNGEERALGITPTTGINSSFTSNCTIGTSGCYDGIINMSTLYPFYFRNGVQPPADYDFYTAVEHETDEILGTTSCLGFCSDGYVSPVDLFRYSSAGTRTFAPGGLRTFRLTAALLR